jgi:hypothetical protein
VRFLHATEGKTQMATVDDYASGKLLAEARQVFSLLNASDESLAGSLQGKALLEATSAWDPMLLTPGEAALAIRASTHCAVGERICGPNHPHAPFAEAVFLDELAEALVATRRAEMVTKEQAIATYTRQVQEEPQGDVQGLWQAHGALLHLA